jgi:polyisoprenoid-binding protein YceI
MLHIMLVTRLLQASALFLGLGWSLQTACAQDRSIDTARSVLKTRVYKSGLFSGFAHDHEIEARIAGGIVHLASSPSVTLTLHARDLRVVDPGISAKDRTEIQRTMEGPAVLDIERFPEISFQSNAVEKKDEHHWLVRGHLTLHGQSSTVEIDVVFRDDRYQGFARLKQREFGITPVSIAGGTIKVKDEVRVEFDIVLKP